MLRWPRGCGRRWLRVGDGLLRRGEVRPCVSLLRARLSAAASAYQLHKAAAHMHGPRPGCCGLREGEGVRTGGRPHREPEVLFTALVQTLGLDPLMYTLWLHPLPFRVRSLPFGAASDDSDSVPTDTIGLRSRVSSCHARGHTA